jgi:methylmalonyl-CoA mutase
MSAAIGGVDSLSLDTFDSTYKRPDELSMRLARNQQIVLKHESYFNKVVDPSAGSYYIENLTDSIARAAWELFVSIDEKGGFMPAVENGYFLDSIAVTSQKRDMDIAMRRQVFVGTNQYPNAGERMLDKLQPTARLSDLGGLRPYRGTQAFEALRLAVENYEQKGFQTPGVFLMAYGNLAMRKARATFSTNFFGIAGYHVTEGDGYKQAAAGIDDVLASKAQIVVFCSSDEEYAELPAIARALKEKSPETMLVVAGNPTDLIDQLKEAGIDGFIHMRTNALEALTWYHQKLGVGG